MSLNTKMIAARAIFGSGRFKEATVEKIMGDFSTEVKMSGDEAESICKLGQGAECCAFLVCGPKGFECIRMSYPANGSIFKVKITNTTFQAGYGDWVATNTGLPDPNGGYYSTPIDGKHPKAQASNGTGIEDSSFLLVLFIKTDIMRIPLVW